MNERDDTLRADESLEQLLGLAAPRPVPAPGDDEIIRNAVHAEWRTVVRRRRWTRQVTGFAMAASVLATLAVVLNTLRVTEPDVSPVARISKSFGSIYVLGQHSELHTVDGPTALLPGETIITDADAGLAITRDDGGSLRLDGDTRVTFTADNAIELRSGRVYFDSHPFGETPVSGHKSSRAFEIRTEFGVVSHAGTQFMVDTSGGELAVSVREGRVEVDGSYYDEWAVAGQQLRLTGRSRPATLDIKGWGEQWSWVERTSPPAAMDGRTVGEFLGWVGRESGLTVRFASPAAERLAQSTKLKGRVDSAPTEALAMWLQTTDLEADIGSDGVITVRKTDAPGKE